VGVTLKTSWEWLRHGDCSGFQRLLQETVDAAVPAVEGAMLKNVLGERPNAALMIFYLVNRGGGRWKDVRAQEKAAGTGVTNVTFTLAIGTAGQKALPVAVLEGQEVPPQEAPRG
jgi:hypothetical protein